MAESSDKMSPSKRPLHFFLRCFGSSPKVQTQKKPATGRRDSRILSLRFRFKKSSATVPIDAAVPEITVPCDDKSSFSPVFKKPPPPLPITSRAPVVRAKIVESIKPSQTRKKTESTQSDSAAERFPPAKRTAALLHSISLPSRRLNRQKDLKKIVSHLPAVETPTPMSSERRQPADKSPTNSPAKIFDLMIVIVVVAMVVLWGQLCAILCTTALFYFCRRLRSKFESVGGGEMRDASFESRRKCFRENFG